MEDHHKNVETLSSPNYMDLFIKEKEINLNNFFGLCDEICKSAAQWFKETIPNVNAKILRIESDKSLLPVMDKLKDKDVFWRYHVVLYDGIYIHDAWLSGKYFINDYLKKAFPKNKKFYLAFEKNSWFEIDMGELK
jgi:hypothetical protein